MASAQDAQTYFPLPERQGGWRRLKSAEEIAEIGGMDPRLLSFACEHNAQFQDTCSVVIIRHGHIVAEWYEHSSLTTTRYDIWSAVKSFTGTAYGLLFDDCRHGKLPPDKTVDLDTYAYKFIPEGYPLTDPRKEKIKLRHLLTMTSGIPGEKQGIAAIPTEAGVGPFEAALGRFPLKARRWTEGRWTDKLVAEPGTVWDYSDPAIAHLALAYYHITGREISDVMQERVFGPVGIESVAWDMEGVGSSLIEPHTNAHTGIHISARELARFGYLMLHKGNWNGQQIVASWWVEMATRSSQEINPNYGFTWWVNTQGTKYPGLPRDAFACSGFRTNRCWVIPSLDMVVARTAAGPSFWDDMSFISKITGSVIGA